LAQGKAKKTENIIPKGDCLNGKGGNQKDYKNFQILFCGMNVLCRKDSCLLANREHQRKHKLFMGVEKFLF